MRRSGEYCPLQISSSTEEESRISAWLFFRHYISPSKEEKDRFESRYCICDLIYAVWCHVKSRTSGWHLYERDALFSINWWDKIYLRKTTPYQDIGCAVCACNPYSAFLSTDICRLDVCRSIFAVVNFTNMRHTDRETYNGTRGLGKLHLSR